ncbi:MAG: hypothetical protein KME45_26795 [Stenomitos rutilans HA7619-LM2]|jgi:hypothetical protein|nr:hypothetical protein [Stenomitos rutilans HA7619-LM2]
MPIGYSTPISAPIGVIAGIVGGYCAEKVAKAMDCPELVCRLAGGAGNFVSSAAVAGVVNSAVGDVGVGYAATITQSTVTGAAHAVLGSFSFQHLLLRGAIEVLKHA